MAALGQPLTTARLRALLADLGHNLARMEIEPDVDTGSIVIIPHGRVGDPAHHVPLIQALSEQVGVSLEYVGNDIAGSRAYQFTASTELNPETFRHQLQNAIAVAASGVIGPLQERMSQLATAHGKEIRVSHR
jgi:hypothetical protein